MKLETKLFHDTGKGCSICGSLPVVNVYGSYWLCGPCVLAEIEFVPDMTELLIDIKRHFADTDAPLGQRAAELLAKQGIGDN